MTAKRGFLVIALLAAAGATAFWLVQRRVATPYTMPRAALSSWTLVTSDGTDPWVVGMKPPDELTASFFQTMTKRAGTQLIAPAHPAVPLVMRTEFDEALQGAFGVDSIQRMARDVGLDTGTAFQPVCLAHRTVNGAAGPAELYFVPFESAGFNQLRGNLMPEHPEQAGIGVYDPGALTPILIVGATENRFERWWPLPFDRERDCEAPIENADR